MGSIGEFFGKYIGIVGVLALGFGAGYIIAPFVDVILPDGYTEIMFLCIGFFTAKNGPNILSTSRDKVFNRTG